MNCSRGRKESPDRSQKTRSVKQENRFLGREKENPSHRRKKFTSSEGFVDPPAREKRKKAGILLSISKKKHTKASGTATPRLSEAACGQPI